MSKSFLFYIVPHGLNHDGGLACELDLILSTSKGYVTILLKSYGLFSDFFPLFNHNLKSMIRILQKY